MKALRYLMTSRIINGTAFYLLWVYCMWAAVKGVAWHAELTVAFYLLLHIAGSKMPVKELILIIVVASAGFIIDSMYIIFGLAAFASPNMINSHLAPLWLVALYGVFAASMNYSLSWLQNRYVAGAALGAAGAFFSYLGGLRMGAIIPLVPQELLLATIAAVWIIFLPLAYWFDGKLSAWHGVRGDETK